MPEIEKDPDEKLLILPLGEESKKITQVISNDTARQIIELLADAPLSASDIAERLKAPLNTVTYNLENLQSVGLARVERIKYSEKGREVRIFGPVRKLIVVVPEKTDRKSVADVLRKYLGVILSALLASGLVEFYMGRNKKTFEITGNLPAGSGVSIESLNATTTGFNATQKGVMGVLNQTVSATPAAEIQSIPASTSTPIVPAPTSVAWNANATAMPIQPSMLDNGATSQAAPDIFTNLANTISAHPGLLFLMGCLFVFAILIVMDYGRKRKNS